MSKGFPKKNQARTDFANEKMILLIKKKIIKGMIHNRKQKTSNCQFF